METAKQKAMEKLTLQQLAVYLPWKLQGVLTHDKREDFVCEEWATEEEIFKKGAIWEFCGYAPGDLNIYLGEGVFDGNLWRNGSTYVNFHRGIKPLLHPISCLTKPITHKGRTFVPLFELAKICQPVLDWKYDEKQEVVYADSNEGFKYCFLYNEIKYSFHFNSLVGTPNQFQLFQKLAEWHINFLNLSDNLFIDKSTLK